MSDCLGLCPALGVGMSDCLNFRPYLLPYAASGTTASGRSACFLTELGLYRLLGMSRKPFAQPFQKWVAQVVREIRKNGKYELEQQYTQSLEAERSGHRPALEASDAREAEHRLALEAALAETAAKEAEAAIALAAKDAELARFRAKTYELVSRLEKVYIAKEASQLDSDKHKIGKTIDDTKRESTFNTGSADGVRMVYVRAVSNGKVVEDIAKHALRRYHHAREHYSCRLEHSVDVYDVAGIVVDAVASSYEFITRRDLFDRVIGELQAERDARYAVVVADPIAADTGSDSDEDPPTEDELLAAEEVDDNPPSKWLNERIQITDNKEDVVVRSELFTAMREPVSSDPLVAGGWHRVREYKTTELEKMLDDWLKKKGVRCAKYGGHGPKGKKRTTVHIKRCKMVEA